MKKTAGLAVLAVLLFTVLGLGGAPADAAAPGPDLATTITPPPLTTVDAVGRYTVRVANVGNQTAASATVTIELPRTHTSPQVYVLGTLGARSANCSAVGTTLVCSFGQIRRSTSTSVYFDIAFPQNAAPLVITATSSTGVDANPANDRATHTAAVRYVEVVGYPAGTATNRHCTGQGLTAFFECRKFPSSIAEHTTVFTGGPTSGTITIPVAPTYSGTWSLSGSNNSHLTFAYYDGADLVATFQGDGVRSSATEHCYEGLVTFPAPSAYVSPYEVCF